MPRSAKRWLWIDKILHTNHQEKPQQTSIQWHIFRRHIATAGISVLTVCVLISLYFFVIMHDLLPALFSGTESEWIRSGAWQSVMLIISAVSIGLAFSFAAVIGFYNGRMVKHSYFHINRSLHALGRGRFQIDIPEQMHREMTEVKNNVNELALNMSNQVQSLQRLVQENKDLSEHAETAASVKERRKLARELHDSVSQQLFAASMLIPALARLINDEPEQARQQLNKLETMIRHGQQELRALIMHLRPVTLGGQSLAKGSHQWINEMQAKHPHLQMRLRTETDHITIPPAIEDELFRIMQEALSNALRHAHASTVSIDLKDVHGKLLLRIEDDGIGMDQTQRTTSNYGLTMMEERVQDIGGQLNIVAYPGLGTRIEVRIPLNEEKGEIGKR